MTHRGAARARRVLMIAYIFPPIGGSAVYRNLCFARYLPEFGWLPTVVCGRDDAHAQGTDPSLLRLIPPEVEVVRRPFVSALGPRRRAKRLLGFKGDPLPRPPGDSLQLTTPEALPAGPESASPKAPLRRLLGALALPLAPIEHPPVDAGFYWALSIVPACLRLVRQRHIDAILSESFPYTDHLAALIVHRLTGVPWVADFHDPFSRNAVFQHAGWRRRADLWLERQVLRHAARVVACTEPYTQDFRDLAPWRDPADFSTIPNGYDRPELDRLRAEGAEVPLPWPPSDKVTLAHVGHVFPGTAIPFLQALRRLEPEAAGRLRVVFVGGLAAPDMRWLKDNPVPVEILFSPRVPLARALGAMQAADAVLVLVGEGPLWTGHQPGKLFDCFYSGAPILLSGPRGAAAQALAECGAGCLAPAGDLEATRALLRHLALDPAGFRREHYHPRPEAIARYERRALAGRLAQVLGGATQRLVGEARPAGGAEEERAE